MKWGRCTDTHKCTHANPQSDANRREEDRERPAEGDRRGIKGLSNARFSRAHCTICVKEISYAYTHWHFDVRKYAGVRGCSHTVQSYLCTWAQGKCLLIYLGCLCRGYFYRFMAYSRKTLSLSIIFLTLLPMRNWDQHADPPLDCSFIFICVSRRADAKRNLWSVAKTDIGGIFCLQKLII